MALTAFALFSAIAFIFANRRIKVAIFFPLFVFTTILSALCCFEIGFWLTIVGLLADTALLLFILSVMSSHVLNKNGRPRIILPVIFAVIMLFSTAYAQCFNGIESFSDSSEYFEFYPEIALGHYIFPARITDTDDGARVYSVFECRAEYLMESDGLVPAVSTEVEFRGGEVIFRQDSGELITRIYRTRRRVAD